MFFAVKRGGRAMKARFAGLCQREQGCQQTDGFAVGEADSCAAVACVGLGDRTAVGAYAEADAAELLQFGGGDRSVRAESATLRSQRACLHSKLGGSSVGMVAREVAEWGFPYFAHYNVFGDGVPTVAHHSKLAARQGYIGAKCIITISDAPATFQQTFCGSAVGAFGEKIAQRRMCPKLADRYNEVAVRECLSFFSSERA